MTILGLNYYFHDSTACLVHDGKLLSAIEEERLTRNKHSREFPERAISRCLELAGLQYSDVDHIAVSIQPFRHWFRRSVYALSKPRYLGRIFRHEAQHVFFRQGMFWKWFRRYWPDRRKAPPVHLIPHHLSHAAGSFFVSPFQEAALLGIDGSGEWSTTFLGHGDGRRIITLGESIFPHSLGSFYESATQFCGFRTNYDEGKTMGLAPLGDPEAYLCEANEIVSVDGEGQIKIDLSFFRYQNMDWKRCSDKFFQTFGPQRKSNQPIERHHENLAAAFQRVLEERVLAICNVLHKRTACKNLVISGGVALNSVMNGRIVRESPFESLYVMPAAGDNGTAIGAAYVVQHQVLRLPRDFVHNDPYVGTSYNDEEIEVTLNEAKSVYRRETDICASVVELLMQGKIVGWFQGKMEIGPRALGARSILANPGIAEMKDKINAEVKFREPFRPFAPSVAVEQATEFFDTTVDTPFMLKVCNVRPEKRGLIPAVVHVDGSARLQTVSPDLHPVYHRLLTKFGGRSGFPVLLNTSFNIQGEPLVESPRDAIRCYFSTGLDALAIGNFLLVKPDGSTK